MCFQLLPSKLEYSLLEETSSLETLQIRVKFLISGRAGASIFHGDRGPVPGDHSKMEKIVDDQGRNAGYATFVETMAKEALDLKGLQLFMGHEAGRQSSLTHSSFHLFCNQCHIAPACYTRRQ